MRPVATPLAKGASLAKAKEDDANLEVATVEEIAADSKRVAAAADAQSSERDPLGLFDIEEGGIDEEDNSSRSSDESMDAVKDALKDPVAAKESQRQHRRAICLTEAPAPPHSMVAAAKRAAEPSDSSGDAVMIERSVDSVDLREDTHL